MAVAALYFLVVLFLATAMSSVISPDDPNHQGDLVISRYESPSFQHPFGTDKFARDVFSRVLCGGRISLSIAFSVVFLSLTIGILYGTFSGYFGGWVDSVLMRLLDFVLAFPIIFLVIAIVAIFRPGLWSLILVLSVTGWMDVARLVRSEVLTVKERDFVLAARGLGFGHLHILFRHVIPNCLTPAIVAAPLKISEIILLESALSFLGIGVQPPTASWGNIINDGRQVLVEAWWISVFAGIFIVLTVMSFNLIGEAIQNSMRTNSA